MEEISIDGNQWECDCHNEWLLDLLNQEKYFKYAKRAYCTRPKNVKGFSFFEAKNEELPCEDQETFDFKKKDFGRPHIYNRSEAQMIGLTITIGCILAILGKIPKYLGTYSL